MELPRTGANQWGDVTGLHSIDVWLRDFSVKRSEDLLKMRLRFQFDEDRKRLRRS
jgi:hypothetical protein